MPIKPASPFRTISKRALGVIFRHEDGLLKEVLPTTGDEDLVHIIDSVQSEEKLRLFRSMPPERQGKILNELSEYSTDVILDDLAVSEIMRMIGAVESDFAVDIIQWLDDAKRARVVGELRKHDPHGLLPLLVFGEDTAGGLMKTEILKFSSDLTVDDVRHVLAKEAQGRLKTHFLYVVDDEDVLIGHVSPLKLLQAGPKVMIQDVRMPETVTLPAGMDQEQVAKVFDEHDAIELPVVNSKGKLLGVITADDIFEVMEEEYAKDVQVMAGVSGDAHITDPVLLSARRRIPWLSVNLITMTAAAAVISLFQGTIERTVILAAFMPAVAGIGGNAAHQALAVTIRAMAFGDLHALNTLRTIGKEIMVGTLNGLITGVVMGVLVYFWTGNPMMGVVIVLAMTLNLFAAGLVGVGVPVTLKAVRKDPAIASTVFITASTDIFGFFVFLGLASIML